MSAPSAHWAQIQAAINAAMAAGSGFDPEQVIWGYQNENQPVTDYVSLSLSGLLNPGMDGQQTTTDLTRPAGQEVAISVLGFREVTLQVEVYTKATVSTADGDTALAVIDRMRTKFALNEVRAQLHKVGVSLFDLTATASFIPEVVSVRFRGRAVWPIRCYVPAPALREFTGYIASVVLQGTVHGGGVDPETVDVVVS